VHFAEHLLPDTLPPPSPLPPHNMAPPRPLVTPRRGPRLLPLLLLLLGALAVRLDAYEIRGTLTPGRHVYHQEMDLSDEDVHL
jgi:hypothetical protein